MLFKKEVRIDIYSVLGVKKETVEFAIQQKQIQMLYLEEKLIMENLVERM